MKTRTAWERRFLYFCLLVMVGGLTTISAQLKVPLNGTWNLTFWPQTDGVVTNPADIAQIETEQITATVPGNVELDLLAAGLIDDPMIGSNVYKLRKYEGYQWCYTKHFDSPDLQVGQKVELSFGGIDCFADVWLNGVRIGSVDNMFIEHIFDVTKYLLTDKKDNLLQVIIRSAVIEGYKPILGTFSINNPAPESVYIRKAPHSYGWDIMPRLVSSGLWREVELRIQNPVRIMDVNWMTLQVDLNNETASGCVDIQIKAPFTQHDNLKAVVCLDYEGRTIYKHEEAIISNALRVGFKVNDAKFWWPRGYGEASLYDAVVQIVDEHGSVLSTDKRKVGLRKISLDMSVINSDADGRFCFIVNGERIFIRGTNWVPLDGFHSRDISWVDSTIDMVADLNCNMVRCWGGNVYEDHHFFDLCDAKGIMVWQDFAMGCTFYPQRMDFATQIEKEVTSVVLKLRNHPSIVLWSGNNENDASLIWSLIRDFNIDPNKDIISRVVIPQVLYEFDPSRPYLPSSPYYSPLVHEKGSKDDDLPENHLWGPRGYYKAPFYTQTKARFVSEIGYHGCPNKESLERMFTKESVYPWVKGQEWNDEWLTKSVRDSPSSRETAGRNDLMINQVSLMFGSLPTELNDFISASQFVQAEAMKYFIEKWRGAKFDKTGIIWWNVRDGWPIISDAVVDYYNSKKLAYYFIKNVQYDVCVFLNDPVEGDYPLVVANDTRKPASGNVSVTDVQSGKKLYKGEFVIKANDRLQIAALPKMKGQGILLIEYEMNGERKYNHYLYGEPPFQLNEYKQLLQRTGIYKSM